jgi:hypothetical protein
VLCTLKLIDTEAVHLMTIIKHKQLVGTTVQIVLLLYHVIAMKQLHLG